MHHVLHSRSDCASSREVVDVSDRNLCRFSIVNDGSARQHWEWHRDIHLALGDILMAESYNALIAECL